MTSTVGSEKRITLSKLYLIYADYYEVKDRPISVNLRSGVFDWRNWGEHPGIVTKGKYYSNVYNWDYIVVREDEITADTMLTGLKEVGFTPLSVMPDGSGIAVPWNRYDTPPDWVTYKHPYNPWDASVPEVAPLAVLNGGPLSYGAALLFYHDYMMTGTRFTHDVKWRSKPWLFAAQDVDETRLNLYFGTAPVGHYQRDKSTFPKGGPPAMWVTLLMMLISYFLQKKSGASNTKALVTAGLVGAGTYYVTHETDWGKANLGAFDGVPGGGSFLEKNADGTTMTDVNGQPIKSGTGIGDVLTSWGATGTAKVLGTAGAVAGTGIFGSKWMPWLLVGGGIWLVTRRND